MQRIVPRRGKETVSIERLVLCECPLEPSVTVYAQVLCDVEKISRREWSWTFRPTGRSIQSL